MGACAEIGKKFSPQELNQGKKKEKRKSTFMKDVEEADVKNIGAEFGFDEAEESNVPDIGKELGDFDFSDEDIEDDFDLGIKNIETKKSVTNPETKELFSSKEISELADEMSQVEKTELAKKDQEHMDELNKLYDTPDLIMFDASQEDLSNKRQEILIDLLDTYSGDTPMDAKEDAALGKMFNLYNKIISEKKTPVKEVLDGTCKTSKCKELRKNLIPGHSGESGTNFAKKYTQDSRTLALFVNKSFGLVETNPQNIKDIIARNSSNREVVISALATGSGRERIGDIFEGSEEVPDQSTKNFYAELAESFVTQQATASEKGSGLASMKMERLPGRLQNALVEKNPDKLKIMPIEKQKEMVRKNFDTFYESTSDDYKEKGNLLLEPEVLSQNEKAREEAIIWALHPEAPKRSQERVNMFDNIVDSMDYNQMTVWYQNAYKAEAAGKKGNERLAATHEVTERPFVRNFRLLYKKFDTPGGDPKGFSDLIAEAKVPHNRYVKKLEKSAVLRRFIQKQESPSSVSGGTGEVFGRFEGDEMQQVKADLFAENLSALDANDTSEVIQTFFDSHAADIKSSIEKGSPDTSMDISSRETSLEFLSKISSEQQTELFQKLDAINFDLRKRTQQLIKGFKQEGSISKKQQLQILEPSQKKASRISGVFQRVFRKKDTT